MSSSPQKKSYSPTIDLTGHRFGRLVAIHPSDRSKRWICLCDCGTLCEKGQGKLREGQSRSCGCLQKELFVKRSRVHGLRFHPLYMMWIGIRQRCLKPACKTYQWYGARGIKVCDRWRDSFEAFLTDVGDRPSPAHSLDRIDNDGNYEPGNVRWATAKEQARNKRCNVRITSEGVSLTAAEWSERTGVPAETIINRFKRGVPAKDCVSVPPGQLRRKKLKGTP